MFRAISKWLRGTKTVPSESRGYDVFVFIKAPTMATSWAASRARREDPADLQSLWENCPRADWLLKIALAAGVDAALVNDVAKKLLGEGGEASPQPIEAVTLLVDERLASNAELQELEEEEAILAVGGRGSDHMSPLGDMGMHDDKLFECRHRVDQLREKLNRDLSDPVRRLISYEQVRGRLYGAVQNSPYR